MKENFWNDYFDWFLDGGTDEHDMLRVGGLLILLPIITLFALFVTIHYTTLSIPSNVIILVGILWVVLAEWIYHDFVATKKKKLDTDDFIGLKFGAIFGALNLIITWIVAPRLLYLLLESIPIRVFNGIGTFILVVGIGVLVIWGYFRININWGKDIQEETLKKKRGKKK